MTFTRVATTLEHLEKYPTYSGDDVFLRDDGSCTGSSGAVRGGSAVTVMDDKGAVVGVGALAETGRGHRTKAAGAGGLSTNETTTCVVTFSIPKVPARPFYKVQLAHLDSVTVQGDTASAVHLTV